MNEIMIRLQNILNSPLLHRCNEIRILVRDCSYKELQIAFPLLLESLFGTPNQTGWGLFNITSTNSAKEYDAMIAMLYPKGCMFDLIYRLMADCYLKYEFSLSLFPAHVRKSLEEDIPQYYLDKMQVDQQSRIVTALALNPFEYYMFHFAVQLVNPWVTRTTANVLIDTVYSTLVEYYLESFLPCDGSPVQPVIDYYMIKNPIPRPPVISTPVRNPTIFRPTMLNKTNPPASLHASPIPNQASPHMEVWRTETVIQAFTDIWLTYAGNEMNSFTCDLPSVDRLRIIRLLVKHFHLFANTANRDMSAMGEVKSVVRHVTRQKIYTFFRRTIHDWPLDSSFRAVLETWLSYIQPWRYTQYAKQARLKGRDEVHRRVDLSWVDFIIENLFAYTIIFQQIIPRFARLDLTTPRNAHMMHRLTKVFAQSNLNRMIAEAEACLNDEFRWGSGRMPHLSNLQLGPVLEDALRHSDTLAANGPKWNAILRQSLQELEGPHFEYSFLFDNSYDKVNDILQMIREAAIAARIFLKVEEKHRAERNTSWLSWIRSFFTSGNEGSQYSIDERRKVMCYLDLSLECMASFFMVDPPRLPALNSVSIEDLSLLVKADGTSYYQQLNSSLFTASESHTQKTLRNYKFQKACVSYEGDPDQEPVRSNEFETLVWLAHNIASKLNVMYKDEMATLYYREDIVGQISRQILSPPIVIRSYDKRANMRYASLVERTLPPRLSLRFIAYTKQWYFFAAVIAGSWHAGHNPLFFVFGGFVFWALWTLLLALCEPFLRRSSTEHSSEHTPLIMPDVSDQDISPF